MAKDIIHDAVKNALIKDGWTITAENFQLRYKEVKIVADISAERNFIAEKDDKKIIVEVKSFLGKSKITELEKAIGQYRIYRRVLNKLDLAAKLYLAVSDVIYKQFFTGEGVSEIVEDEEISMVVVNTEIEEILKWIN